MTLDDMERLWPLARIIHEARRDLAWGKITGQRREPWPEFHRSYTHNPIAYVDLALASAEAVDNWIDPNKKMKEIERQPLPVEVPAELSLATLRRLMAAYNRANKAIFDNRKTLSAVEAADRMFKIKKELADSLLHYGIRLTGL